jgi:hypothetical protein
VNSGQLSFGSNIIPAANLGTGVNATYFLRGDGTWQPVSGGAGYITSVDSNYFTVNIGELLFNGPHAQAIGTTDAPTFIGIIIGNVTGAIGASIYTLDNSEVSWNLGRAQTGGTYNVVWWESIQPSSTDLWWWLGSGSYLMKLDTSGNLGIVGNMTVGVNLEVDGSQMLFDGHSNAMTLELRSESNQQIILKWNRQAGGAYDIAWYEQLKVSDTGLHWWNGSIAGDRMALDTSGNLVVAGAVTATEGVITDYLSGAYGATWGSLPSFPTPTNGMMVLLYNTDTSESRIYVYSNGAWDFFRKSVVAASDWYVYISPDTNRGTISPLGAQTVVAGNTLTVTYTSPPETAEYNFIHWLFDGSVVGVGNATYIIPVQTAGTIHTLVPVTAIATPPNFFVYTGVLGANFMAEEGDVADSLFLDLPPSRAESNTITNS